MIARMCYTGSGKVQALSFCKRLFWPQVISVFRETVGERLPPGEEEWEFALFEVELPWPMDLLGCLLLLLELFLLLLSP